MRLRQWEVPDAKVPPAARGVPRDRLGVLRLCQEQRRFTGLAAAMQSSAQSPPQSPASPANSSSRSPAVCRKILEDAAGGDDYADVAAGGLEPKPPQECWQTPRSSKPASGGQARRPFSASVAGVPTGLQVEKELARLSSLLHGLLEEFSLLKDSVWHLQEERSGLQGEQGFRVKDGLSSVCMGCAKADERLEDLTARTEATEHRQDVLVLQLCRLDVLEARLSSCEAAESWGGALVNAARLDVVESRLGACEARRDTHRPSEGVSSAAPPRPCSVASEVWSTASLSPNGVQDAASTVPPDFDEAVHGKAQELVAQELTQMLVEAAGELPEASRPASAAQVSFDCSRPEAFEFEDGLAPLRAREDDDEHEGSHGGTDQVGMSYPLSSW